MSTAILLKPVPWEEAAKFLDQKPVALRRTFDRMIPEIRARAFTVAGLEREDVLRDIRDAVAALPRGARWEDVKKDVLAKLGPHAPLSGTDEERKKAAARASMHAELILRSNGFVCASAAQTRAVEEDRDTFPAWRYHSFEDSRVRPSHAALDGLVLPADDPFWDDHTPPWEWGCRCWRTPATKAELDKAREGKIGWSPGPAALRSYTRTGMLDKGDAHPFDARSPRRRAKDEGRDPAREWGWNPGDLRIPLDSLHARYDAETWSRFQRAMDGSSIELADGRRETIWTWLLEPALEAARRRALAFGAATGREALVAVDYLTGKTLAWTEGAAKDVRSATALKAARAGKTRAVLVHNHPGGGTLSPRDVATLLQNRDAVERVEAHSQWFQNIARVAPGNENPTALLSNMRAFVEAQDAGTLVVAKWEMFLRRLNQNGVLIYEERPGV